MLVYHRVFHNFFNGGSLEAVYMGALTDSSDVSEFFVSASQFWWVFRPEVNDELKTHKSWGYP